jgi:hypothetical protein
VVIPVGTAWLVRAVLVSENGTKVLAARVP